MAILPAHPHCSQSEIADSDTHDLVLARKRLDELYVDLNIAREILLDATAKWIAANGWPEGARMRGALSRQDPVYIDLRKAMLRAARDMQTHSQGSRGWSRARQRWQSAQLRLLDAWEQREGGDSDAATL
jgi:hypothetical protein